MHRELPPDLTHTGPVRPTATCPMAKFIHTTNDKPYFTKTPVFPGYVSLSALEITDCSHMPVLTYRELTPALTIVKLHQQSSAGHFCSRTLAHPSSDRKILHEMAPACPCCPTHQAIASSSLQVSGIFMAAVITPRHPPAATSLPLLR